MRLLLHNNPPPRLAALLKDAGHDTEHVRDHGMQAAADEDVLSLAREQRPNEILGNATDVPLRDPRTRVDELRASGKAISTSAHMPRTAAMADFAALR
jgi:Domain of unknown function (DUF5615)